MEETLTIEIPKLGKTFYVPLSLNRCDEEQYIAICGLLYRLETKEIHFDDFCTLAVYELLKLKKGPRRLPERQTEEALSNIAVIAQHMKEFFAFEGGKVCVKLEYLKSHIQEIVLPSKILHGPADYFSDVEWGEYEDALNAFLEYQQTPSRALLERLTAILYREKSAGDRCPYLPQSAKANLLHLLQLPIGLLYGVYYTFAAFHVYFTAATVSLEGKPIDMSIIFTVQSGEEGTDYQSPFPSLGMKSITFQLAESGVFGPLPEVRATNLWEIACRLYDMRKRDLDQLAQQPKQNKPK